MHLFVCLQHGMCVCECVSVRVRLFLAWSMFLIFKVRCKDEMSVRASGKIDNMK